MMMKRCVRSASLRKLFAAKRVELNSHIDRLDGIAELKTMILQRDLQISPLAARHRVLSLAKHTLFAPDVGDYLRALR